MAQTLLESRIMHAMKTILILPDGMADEPLAELNGRTPLQAANTPAMDTIAREGRCGTLRTLPEGFPTSSDVANMSVMGCDLASEYCGRGVLEAFSQRIPLTGEDVAFRMNLCTTDADGRLTDFSGGHPSEADAAAVIALLNERLGSEAVRFHTGVSYRNLLILHGRQYSPDVYCQKPDDNCGNLIAEHLPKPAPGFEENAAAQETVRTLLDVMTRAAAVLKDSPFGKPSATRSVPINAVWPWSGGRAGAIRKLKELRGISGAVISAVDVINGLGAAMGMDVVRVPGATGYIDTNYEGKAAAALDAIRTHDFVYVHIEATDEVSHACDLQAKLKVIEDVDSRLVAPILAGAGPEVRIVLLPDHPVPIAIGRHTRTPVPVAVRTPGETPDAVQTYDEIACPQGSLGHFLDAGLMDFLFPPVR